MSQKRRAVLEIPPNDVGIHSMIEELRSVELTIDFCRRIAADKAVSDAAARSGIALALNCSDPYTFIINPNEAKRAAGLLLELVSTGYLKKAAWSEASGDIFRLVMLEAE